MYHVKLLLKYTVKEQIFYEESILQVDAGSFDEAYQKAEIYVKQTMDNKRRNMYGDIVHCTVVDYLDCFQSDDAFAKPRQSGTRRSPDGRCRAASAPGSTGRQ